MIRSIGIIFLCLLFTAVGVSAQGNGAGNKPGNLTAFRIEPGSREFNRNCRFRQDDGNGGYVIFRNIIVDHPVSNGNRSAILTLTGKVIADYQTDQPVIYSVYQSGAFGATFGYLDPSPDGLVSLVPYLVHSPIPGRAFNVDCPENKWLVLNISVTQYNAANQTVRTIVGDTNELDNAALLLTVAKP